MKKIRSFLITTLTSATPRGSKLGLYIRKTLKHLNFRQILGVNLAGMAFFAGIIIPQSQEAISNLEVSLDTQKTVVVLQPSASLFQWPLQEFGISQMFSIYHPGMDLTNPIGTPIYPIADGIVSWTKNIPFGYSSHVLVTHDNGIQSLYAHMSKILVHEGSRVTKHTPLGLVGVTGWTTGSHLHFEVYQENAPTNPIEILPEIK